MSELVFKASAYFLKCNRIFGARCFQQMALHGITILSQSDNACQSVTAVAYLNNDHCVCCYGYMISALG